MIAALNHTMDDKVLNPTCQTKPFKGAVYVQGSFMNAATRRMFKSEGFDIVESIEDSDIVVWTGGSDISPSLYNQKPTGCHSWSENRDKDDVDAVKRAGGRFKIGVCRGAQLLNVIPNGGSLWQDVNKHGGSNHSVTDAVTGLGYIVNSLHHQQLVLTDKAELVAYTNLSTYKESQLGTWHHTDGVENKDVEAAYYPDTRSLCVQWHPEMGGNEDSTSYFFELVGRYYLAA